MAGALSEAQLTQRDAAALMLAAGADDREGMVRLVAEMTFDRIANVPMFCATYAAIRDGEQDGGSAPRRAAMRRSILDLVRLSLDEGPAE